MLNKYLKTADSDWYKQRVIAVILCVLACFAVLLIRLFYLQIIKGSELRRLSENNSIRLQRIVPFRGLIFDRNGKMMVDNRPSFDVSVIRRNARPLDQTLDKLSQYLRVPVETLTEKISKNKRLSSYKPITLKQDISRNAVAVVEAHQYDLPGIEVNVKSTRHYLYQGSAAHLLGYLGEISSGELDSGKYPDLRSGDLIGKLGIERAYGSYLRGQSGGRQVEVNVNGQVVRILKTVSAKPGQNVYLTIDLDVQQKAEELLQEVIGAAVALQPASGQVLALASSPSFDQNTIVSGMTYERWKAFVNDPLKPLTNRALQGEYPPASTYKILTAIAGLEEGVIDEKTEFCCPGFYRFKGRSYRCWKKGGHGCVNVIGAIAQSCDTYFYQVGQAVGVDRLAWYAKATGLGKATGINLPHEANGLIPTAAWKKKRTGIAWQPGETLSLAIGQGFNLVTPLQMAVLTAAVANGGILYKPEILKKVETAEGQLVAMNEPVSTGRLPVSDATMKLIKQGLWEVVNTDKGTAKGARFYGLEVSGKTGTAQVISRKDGEEEDPDLPDHLKPHAWFVAYSPATEPEIAVVVMVEHGEHGSSAAAPIAREMIKAYLLKKQLQPLLVANGRSAME